MHLRNAVKFTHMALRLVPEILNTVDVIPVLGKELRVVDPEVFEVRHIQHIVAPPAVRIDDAVGHHLALNDRYQCGRGSVWNDLGVDLPAPLKL